MIWALGIVGYLLAGFVVTGLIIRYTSIFGPEDDEPVVHFMSTAFWPVMVLVVTAEKLWPVMYRLWSKDDDQ